MSCGRWRNARARKRQQKPPLSRIAVEVSHVFTPFTSKRIDFSLKVIFMTLRPALIGDQPFVPATPTGVQHGGSVATTDRAFPPSEAIEREAFR